MSDATSQTLFVSSLPSGFEVVSFLYRNALSDASKFPDQEDDLDKFFKAYDGCTVIFDNRMISHPFVTRCNAGMRRGEEF